MGYGKKKDKPADKTYAKVVSQTGPRKNPKEGWKTPEREILIRMKEGNNSKKVLEAVKDKLRKTDVGGGL